jgi:Ca2+/H+ antiporter
MINLFWIYTSTVLICAIAMRVTDDSGESIEADLGKTLGALLLAATWPLLVVAFLIELIARAIRSVL